MLQNWYCGRYMIADQIVQGAVCEHDIAIN